GELVSPEQLRTLRNGSPEERNQLLSTIPDSKLDDLIFATPGGLRQQLVANAGPALRRKIMVVTAPGQVIQNDLIEAKLYRAIYSNRQLEEQMVDFWFNHFNVT